MIRGLRPTARSVVLVTALASLGAGTLARAAELPRAPDDAAFAPAKALSVEIGRDLFFDPILSGNRNTSCATCHHPALGTSDGRALPLGEGGAGLGPERRATASNPPRVIPRNAPALFNLGAAEFTVLFHDGRLRRDASADGGIAMPNGLSLDQPLSPVAAQAMMPVIAPDEMAGQRGENPVANAVAEGRITGPDGAWQMLADRVAAISAYHDRFAQLNGPEAPIQMSDIAATLGDFISTEFRATNSRFDAFLAGDYDSFSPQEQHGLGLFYGKAGCHTCHSGPFLTDHRFHAIGLPQTGPGKGHGPLGFADHGHGAVTGNAQDAYRFRTPSLRNIARTAPYGHAGSHATLEDIIRHHADPGAGLATFAPAADDLAMSDEAEMMRIYAAITLQPVPLTEAEIAALVAFLNTLTDETPSQGRLGAPSAVPSQLPVDAPPANWPLSKPATQP